jgi:Double zinc ribbon
MANCPRCHNSIDAKAIKCPHCGLTLKAYGHPGITLHRAKGDEYLCDSCAYHEDDTCTFPKRPYAKDCTLYQDRSVKILPEKLPPTASQSFKFWYERYKFWIFLSGLILFSFIIALIQS